MELEAHKRYLTEEATNEMFAHYQLVNNAVNIPTAPFYT